MQRKPYYAKNNGIYKRPDGGTMGFRVGTVDGFVDKPDEAAEEIVDALNKIELHTVVDREKLDAVYQERNRLVALLARIYPSGISRTDIEGWDPDWHNVVYIDTPMGQMSWHYHTRDAWMFSGLDFYAGQWDGHSTEEKYNRMRSLVETLDRQKLLGVGPLDRVGLAGLAAVDAALSEPHPSDAANIAAFGCVVRAEKDLPTTYTDWLAGTDAPSSDD